MSALAYWEQRFTEDASHHAQQNGQIARSFFGLINGQTTGLGYLRFRQALQSDRIIEVGCGTGEFAAMIAWAFRTPFLLGTDLSPAGIEAARKRYPYLNWAVLDVMSLPLEPPPPPEPGWVVQLVCERYDLAVCSNVLEHFSDPHAVIDRIFTFADQLLAIVPYRQPVSDEYRAEGEAGHVTCFSKKSFARYEIVESVVFETPGWTYSSRREKPQQIAVLVRPK